jgi:pyruvate/2-oxoglutarate dehydrogenase complex dihydrolipoamide dehydrogenase (E3) component
VNDNAIGFAGTCVNVGCVPTKHLLYVGEPIYKIKKHNFEGLKSSIAFDFPTVAEEQDKPVETVRSKDGLTLEGHSNCIMDYKIPLLSKEVNALCRCILKNT